MKYLFFLLVFIVDGSWVCSLNVEVVLIEVIYDFIGGILFVNEGSGIVFFKENILLFLLGRFEERKV